MTAAQAPDSSAVIPSWSQPQPRLAPGAALVLGPGVRLGNYEIRHRLRETAAGVTWHARHVTSSMDVEVRLLPDERDPLIARRVQREVEALMAVRHQGIVRIWAIGREGGHGYVVMEHVAGQPLAYWLAQFGRLRVADALNVHIDVLAALGELHRRGLVHRDIRPDAIVLSDDGRTVLRDLLLAREATGDGDGDGTLMSADELEVGLYKAPEQIDGVADARSDIYSVGVSLYHCLSGALPFDGEGMQAVLARCEQSPIPLSQRVAGLSPRLESAVARLIARDPADRCQTTSEAIALLGTTA